MRFKAFLKRLYEEYENDAVADSAASLAYYFVFALFPFLFFLTTLTAYVPYVRRSVDTILARAHAILPEQAVGLIDTHLRGLVENQRPRLLTLGLLATLYSASRGVDALRKTLNLAYDVKESRKWWRTELVAFGMTIGGALLVLISITLLTAGGSAGFWLARHVGIAHEYVIVWSWLRWPITALAMMLCAALAYYVLPDVKQKFKFITPGSVIGTLVWLVGTWGFSVYAGNFGSYNVTYGSIGGVIVLLTWFYISGFIFLMGGEMNAIIEHAAPDGKESGARAPGEAPPPKSERPSAVPPGAADSAAAAARSKGGISGEPQGAHR
ncbi:MAG TPA: YihY/virulence factor BrkB family protein [Polyangia bacterium]|jgi:membrane protein|nr:YihY/virulence factor BrkB family protein [Polyangia bacterium]